MNNYIIFGFNPEKVEIQFDDLDLLDTNKIYCVSNYEIEESDKIVSVSDRNVLDLYQELDLENNNENYIFIDCSPFEKSEPKTYFDVMYFLNTSRFENRSYYIFESKILKTLKLSDFKLITHFNPWMGETLPISISKDEREKIMSMYLDAVLIIKSYLKAEFHLKKISSLPDGWMMNISTPVLTHITNFFGLKPAAKDVAINIEFLHNSQFRQIVCKTLIHITSNYLIKNNIVNYVPRTEVSYDWFNLNTWNSLEF